MEQSDARTPTVWPDGVFRSSGSRFDSDAAMDDRFLARLSDLVGSDGLLRDPADLLTYESDALVHLRATPGAVVLPASASQVQAVVRLCHSEGVPFVARTAPACRAVPCPLRAACWSGCRGSTASSRSTSPTCA